MGNRIPETERPELWRSGEDAEYKAAHMHSSHLLMTVDRMWVAASNP